MAGITQHMTITPDLQSRESVMMAAGRAQFAVTYEDGVRYVRFEAKVKNPEGVSPKYRRSTLDEATHVFVSEKGYGTPSLGTYYPPREGYKSGRFFPRDADPAHLLAMADILNYVCDGVTSADVEQINVESACGLCGHKLEDPVSVQRGIGPECAGKPTGSKILHASVFGEQQELPVHDPQPHKGADFGTKSAAQVCSEDAEADERLGAVQAIMDEMTILELQQVAAIAEEQARVKEEGGMADRGWGITDATPTGRWTFTRQGPSGLTKRQAREAARRKESAI